MKMQRKIARITHSPLQPGFLGRGHQAAAVIDGSDFQQTDPFILLMDDRLDLPGGEPVGGPHPHAGFETVTFVLQGNEHGWKTGSLEIMTAGKGIVHTEEITEATHMHILQLWLALPPAQRWAEPLWQLILPENVPSQKESDREIRVYSGSSQGLKSPVLNHTPLTLVDFQLEKRARVTQELPSSYTGFLYVVDGSVQVDQTIVKPGDTAWLSRPEGADESEISFEAGDKGARFILYAAQPHGVRVVSHGPFIGDNSDDIVRLYREYRQGKMPHLNDLPEDRKIRYTAI